MSTRRPEPAQALRCVTGPPPIPHDRYCPACGAALVRERCKVVCRSERCVYRIVFNCSEF